MIQKVFTLDGSYESNILGKLKSKLNMPPAKFWEVPNSY